MNAAISREDKRNARRYISRLRQALLGHAPSYHSSLGRAIFLDDIKEMHAFEILPHNAISTGGIRSLTGARPAVPSAVVKMPHYRLWSSYFCGGKA